MKVVVNVELSVVCAVCNRPLDWSLQEVCNGLQRAVAEPCKWERCASKPHLIPVGDGIHYDCPTCHDRYRVK